MKASMEISHVCLLAIVILIAFDFSFPKPTAEGTGLSILLSIPVVITGFLLIRILFLKSALCSRSGLEHCIRGVYSAECLRLPKTTDSYRYPYWSPGGGSAC